MSSIVLGIIQHATGTLFHNVCDHIANRLKNGDCTDEQCRQMIVRELDDIKSKLDGFARKDLQSSVCFLKDGLCILNYTLDETPSDADISAINETENTLVCVKECLNPYNNEDLPFSLTESNEALNSQISIFNKALALSPRNLAVTYNERFASARLSLEQAYSKATEAFNNEVLSTTERILATKLRVVSKILQCLEDPELAMAFCKLYLQQLHELPAVRKRFAVFFQSQVKSHLHKKKRVDDVRCVVEINYALYEYAKMFTKNAAEILSSWPKIKLRKKVLNPLLMCNKVLKKIEKCGLRSPNQFLFKEINSSECVAMNSKGEIITINKHGICLEVISRNGEVVSLCRFEKEDTKREGFEILALAVNVDDSVYAVTRYKARDAFRYKLSVFDDATNLGQVKQQVFLECLTGRGESHHSVCLVVDENKSIFISKQDEAKVFIFNRYGRLTKEFTFPDWNLIKDLRISSTGDVIATELVGRKVGVYTQNGDLKQDITVSGLHKVCGLALDHIEGTILLLTEVLTGCYSEYCLESYSECGELLQTLSLPRQKEAGGYRITSHPNGPLAAVHKTGVIFLRH